MARSDGSQMATEMYEAWEKSMTTWWDQVLESPAFLKSMGSGVTQQVQGRRAYEDAVDTTLEKFHLPTRADLTRVARITSLLEDRLLSLEDRLLTLEDRLVASEKATLQARIDAGEARLAAEDRLAAIEDRLIAIAEKLGSTSEEPTARPRRGRKEG